MKRDRIHHVTITETGDPDEPREFEVEHPRGCDCVIDAEPLPSMFGSWIGSLWWFGGEPGQTHAAWTCWTENDIDAIGAPEFFEEFPVGRSAFQVWGSGPDIWGDYDGGVDIVEEAAAA